MSQRFYKFLCERSGVPSISPNTIEVTRKELYDIPVREITNEVGISYSYASCLKNFITLTPSVKKGLYEVYKLGRKGKETTYVELIKILYGVVPLLRRFNPPPIHKLAPGLYKVDPQILKSYYPDIEKWGVEERRYGIRIRQALEILGVSIEELNTTHLAKIEELSRVDFKMRGYDIPQSSLGYVKRRLKELAIRNTRI